MTAVPVLLLVYRRPRHVARVMEVLRAVRCPLLFVAADGPRRHIAREAEACSAARAAALAIDWQCRVETRFLETNHGCARAVSSAITWFFEHHDRGIVLEEDCVPDRSFFPFCEELLERYADDARIGVVTGNNFQNGRTRGHDSYYFSRYPHCWGWATWRRAWNLFDFNACSDYRNRLHSTRNLQPLRFDESMYWAAMQRMTAAGFVDSWATRWMHSLWRHDMLTVTPQANLVVNIGFDSEATHTKTEPARTSAPQPVSFPLRHPSIVVCDSEADRIVATNYFHTSAWPLNWLSYAKKTLANAVSDKRTRRPCMSSSIEETPPASLIVDVTSALRATHCRNDNRT